MYGEHEALIDIRTLEVVKGSLPKRALALVLEWAAQHRAELMEDWNLVPIETTAQEHHSSGVIPAAPWRVRSVDVLPGYRLSVTCNDGASGIVDMSALINSPNAGIFAALKDTQLFQHVSIELGALTWPNGADLDPVWIHEGISQNKTWSVPV